jgi:hypothetical protein
VSGFIHGGAQPSADLPDVGPCCYGSAINGPQSCTCWEPVFSVEQQHRATPGEMGARTVMCDGCAQKAGSPERTGAGGYEHDDESLDSLVATGTPFQCHQGMRRVVRYRHPSGAEVEANPDDYRPPIVNGVAYKADGTPADLCFGWSLRRAAFLREAEAS